MAPDWPVPIRSEQTPKDVGVIRWRDVFLKAGFISLVLAGSGVIEAGVNIW